MELSSFATSPKPHPGHSTPLITASAARVGSRSILNGYEASAEYVESKINGSGYYNVWRQYFTAMVWTQTVPAFLEVGLDGADGSWVAVSTAIPLADTDDAEACALRYSGITSPDAPLTKSVVFISGGGCDPSNFTDAKGKALLVLSNFSSECNYYQVAWAAEEAGALALLVARSSPGFSLPASRVRDADWTPDSNVVTIPCLGLTFTLGELLRSKPTTAFVRLSVEAVVTYPVTFNIIAETAGHERDDETVVIGAHLDSVPAGPGINDNGSGSASILEMAIQFAALGIKPKRTTQFAWWGAEEVGLLGSRNYVANLSSTEASNTSAMLNFDMLASPNYVRMVYDGTGCPDESRDTCVLLQSMFTDYFTSQNLKYEVVPFSTTGGSDYFPFIRANIPAGSIATGAGSLKTDAQRTSYGGLTKAAFDPCYHQSCDTTENIDSTVYAQMTQAAAHVTINTVNYAGDLR
jgi:hypothetical protein